MTQNRRQPTFFHCPWEMWLKTITTKPNTGSENRIGLSHLYPSLSVPLSFEVLEIQYLTLSKYIHIICGLYNILEINWAGLFIAIPNMREWRN